MTKSLGQEAYELYAEAHSEDGSINPWLNVLPASKQAWHVMANQLAERVIKDWRESEQYCSADAMADDDETIEHVDANHIAVHNPYEGGCEGYLYRAIATFRSQEIPPRKDLYETIIEQCRTDGDAGDENMTLYSKDGLKAYRYLLVETLHIKETHDKE